MVGHKARYDERADEAEESKSAQNSIRDRRRQKHGTAGWLKK
jgi:hypothetical protein